ncbi:conserved hypothetical protein [Paraburkholderia tropica]|uniref:DUF3443 family protein n=1 Tax=Paraburkholderia tropica TaxID=92647 RepID=UPI001CB01D43|nr:DUF3443 family protein [Paraburkholderia tropica]CAG9238664.1 conserved hypothetical protein [Paraburkholderia tropica]
MTTLFSLAVLAGGVARLTNLFPADGASLQRVFRFAPRRAAAGLTACGLMLALAACGGGGSSSDDSSTTTSTTTSSTQSPVTVSASNTMTVTVEQSLSTYPNLPFVSVTVCAPGSTTLCNTIDHVLLDTGSTGLRVLSSALSSTTLAGMPREQLASSGNYIDACGQFVSGYTWGAVRTGDVQLGSQTASSVPLEVIGDSAAGTAPTACSNRGSDMGTVSQLGANGILGLQGQIRDCGTNCVTSTASKYYFACASGASCSTASTVPLSQQVTNPVSMLGSGYNNGIVLSMPTVSDSGQATASGTLYLGVGTQTNNTIASLSQIPLDANFEFQATYGGTANQYSFIDSGTNFLYFQDSSITQCTGSTYSGYYCPSSVQTESVTFAPNSSASSSSGSYTGTFKVGNVSSLLSSSVFAFNDIAVYGLVEGGLDFGMPFFYGRYVVIKNESSSGAGDAYAAFASNGA